MRLAMRFAHVSGSGGAGAASAAVILAEEVLRAMLLAKLKTALAVVLVAAVLVSGAATWARQGRTAAVTLVAAKVAVPQAKAELDPSQAKAAAQPENVMHTIRGIVSDEKGRPVSKAWVNVLTGEPPDTWTIVYPPDLIRERKEPFRDEQGRILPPSGFGRYFELRDQEGKWQPIRFGDIRRYDPTDEEVSDNFPFDRDFIKEAFAKGDRLFVVRIPTARL